jgi:hypothetical protein
MSVKYEWDVSEDGGILEAIQAFPDELSYNPSP